MRRVFISLLACCLSLYYGTPHVMAQNAPEAVDLGLSVKWANLNIGAKAEHEFGWYLAWGEYAEKDHYFFDNYSFTVPDGGQSLIDIGTNISGTEYDPAHILYGGEWRLPTNEEIKELIAECDWAWDKVKDVVGVRVTGPNGKSVFLPAGGHDRNKDVGTECAYWSGTLCPGFGRSAYYLLCAWIRDEGRTILQPTGEYRVNGLLVRAVTDNPDFIPTFHFDKNNPEMMAWSDPKYEDVMLAFAEEDLDMLFNTLTSLSGNGDAKALCALATMYMYGAGTTRDYTTAYNQLKRSAAQGYERAEYLIGSFGSLLRARKMEVYELLTGEAFEGSMMDDYFWQNCFASNGESAMKYIDAFRWFFSQRWAYRDIMYYAAEMFLAEDFELYNYEVGMKWLRRAANSGYPEAVKKLKQMEGE